MHAQFQLAMAYTAGHGRAVHVDSIKFRVESAYLWFQRFTGAIII